MKLSIMFITHNRKEELKRAIKSCIKNSIENMEFVIVDNNSTDGTESEIKQLLTDAKTKFTYFFSNTNLGVSGGRNKAYSLCKGEYIFGFDDDAILIEKDFFKRTCEYMDLNKDVGILSYDIYEPSTGKRLVSHHEKNKNSEGMPLSLSFIGAAHTLRSSIFDDKIYPEKLFFGSEELYASHISWEKGYKVVYISQLKVHHLPSSINRVKGNDRAYNIILNQYIVRILTYPYPLWSILTILLILRLIKNRLCSFKYIKKIIKDIRIRYSKYERYRMSYKTITMLINKFGFRNIF